MYSICIKLQYRYPSIYDISHVRCFIYRDNLPYYTVLCYTNKPCFIHLQTGPIRLHRPYKRKKRDRFFLETDKTLKPDLTPDHASPASATPTTGIVSAHSSLPTINYKAVLPLYWVWLLFYSPYCWKIMPEWWERYLTTPCLCTVTLPVSGLGDLTVVPGILMGEQTTPDVTNTPPGAAATTTSTVTGPTTAASTLIDPNTLPLDKAWEHMNEVPYSTLPYTYF